MPAPRARLFCAHCGLKAGNPCATCEPTLPVRFCIETGVRLDPYPAEAPNLYGSSLEGMSPTFAHDGMRRGVTHR